jgi:hypothetical protein
MGPEMVAMAIAAAGTAAQMSAQEEAADERRSIMNQQLERDDQATRKAVTLVQQEGENYGMDERLKAMKDQEDKTYEQTQADIQGAGGSLVNTAADAGNVSEDFIRGKAERAVTEGGRLTAIAREAAKARAPSSMMSQDALRRAGMVGNLQSTWGTNRNMSRATGVDVNNVQEPGYGALGSIASSIAPAAGGMMGQGAGVSWDADGSYGRKYARGIGM